MGDFNIDMISCPNSKWLNLIQLFDLSQLVKHSTCVTETSSSIIDHAYTTDLGNITECFVPSYAISDHFPICFTRKVNCKIPKTEHIMTSYWCFKTFDDQHFLLPDWYSPEIGQARIARDRCKRLKHWTEYKHYRNKTKILIRNAKRQHFTKSIENFNDTSTLWKHLRAVNNGSTSSGKTLPDELIIKGVHFTDSETIATKFNEYFTSVAQILENTNSDTNDLDVTKLQEFVNNKVPENIHFSIPFITIDQVASYSHLLDPSKATGLDGLGPKIIKLAANSLSLHIAALINKSIISGTFPSELKCAKVFPIFKDGSKSDPSNYRPISILPTVSKIQATPAMSTSRISILPLMLRWFFTPNFFLCISLHFNSVYVENG